MKKFIIAAVFLIISLQTLKKHQVVIVNEIIARPVTSLYLHHAVKIILKRITHLDAIV